MFRLVRGTGHILGVPGVLHREQVPLRIHDGTFTCAPRIWGAAPSPPSPAATLIDLANQGFRLCSQAQALAQAAWNALMPLLATTATAEPR